MGDLDLQDFIFDERTKTLLVRMPRGTSDPPNVDESKQEVRYEGSLITRDMQTRLREAVAIGASKQAFQEANTPARLDQAARAAREAIAQNLEQPLRAAGLNGVRVSVVLAAAEDRERWDVSRSIEAVLSERRK